MSFTQLQTYPTPGAPMRRAWLAYGSRHYSEQITNATIISSHGLPAPTAAGTATVFNDATGQYIDYACANLGNGGWTQNVDIQPQGRVVFSTAIALASVATARVWVGLFSADPSAADDPAGHLAGFRFSTGVPDTNWRCCTKNNVTLTNLDSGIAVAANTRYDLDIDFFQYTSGSVIYFYINGVLVATSSTNLPGATQLLDTYDRAVDLGNAAGRSMRIAELSIFQPGVI